MLGHRLVDRICKSRQSTYAAYSSSRQCRALIFGIKEAFRQGDRFLRHFRIGNLLQQVMDEIEPDAIFSLPSTMYQGASDVLVRSNISSITRV